MHCRGGGKSIETAWLLENVESEINIPESVWSTRLSGGETLEARVSKKSPAVLPMDNRSLVTFISTWIERLDKALAGGDEVQEAKVRGLIKFIDNHQSAEIELLVWNEEHIAAIYDVTATEVFVIE